MAVLEGGTTGTLADVGAANAKGMHVIVKGQDVGALGAYSMSMLSGTMAAALGANSEIFQFRWNDATRFALVHRVSISASRILAATTITNTQLVLKMARAWSAAGSGGSRAILTGNINKLRTSYGTSLVNDAGISTTAALTAGTKTIDAGHANQGIGAVVPVYGTEALTTVVTMVPKTDLFNCNDVGGQPIVLAGTGGGEGLVIMSGPNAFGATMTWQFTVDIVWSEVTAF